MPAPLAQYVKHWLADLAGPGAEAENLPNCKRGSVAHSISLSSCNVCKTLICKLVYLFNMFGVHGRYIGNINHLW